MAETSIRTCLAILLIYSVFEATASKVTFVGFLNDLQHRQFSALLEVELSPNDNAFEAGSQWLASKNYKSCRGPAVYGWARADPEPGPEEKQYKEQIRTLQLLLPLPADHQERTLYLCVRPRGDPNFEPLGLLSEFLLPKVTDPQVLNEENNREFILEPTGEFIQIVLLTFCM